MITVVHPTVIEFGGPSASINWSPCRAAGRPPIFTVAEPCGTMPGPCGGRGSGTGQACRSGGPPGPPPDAIADIIAADIAAAAAALVASSAALAAGRPGVPAAASVASSAVFIAASHVVFCALTDAIAAGFPMALHAGWFAINTVGQPVPRSGGPWPVGSPTLAAGGMVQSCRSDSARTRSFRASCGLAVWLGQAVGSPFGSGKPWVRRSPGWIGGAGALRSGPVERKPDRTSHG